MLDSIPSFARLVAELSKLPGIGKKTAARLVFHLLRRPAAEVEALAAAIAEIKRNVRFCSCCFSLTEQDPCRLCVDPARDDRVLCVVEQPQDLIAIERSRSFRGRYHVLHGALSPLDGMGPEDLHLAELMTRLEGVEEVVVATNFSVEGEATALYLADQVKGRGIRVTRLAYGIPMGSDLEFVDEATVNRAVEGRREL
ncbi:DNA replication and repair protein RecR [Geoalkalibacter ferrihydriticus]|uniref:Recombination protein RecR n=2 Tax=Geoalkalibacter ferrihydriticus TaxID=392333 RepID=A0A0C2DVP2_9BACT|nr:recombination mediator RecR [Geoalkalibacter ferrihydriticus]KIH77514.1 recombinase RecR [Geoalkalibacter ferrihydriticus DSM 17813]SDL65452.1 DNA replication and repair protein RecR [Geoalkalibacter ferrihydriticus]